MTEFHVAVVRVGAVEKHPNADSLSITKVYDYPVVLRTGDFQPGDLAVYVPVDAVVPKDDPRWAFLGGHNRIKAKRLRGVFSMGLLASSPNGAIEGDDVADLLGITKYEPPVELSSGGEAEPDPGFLPVYTDIEGLRRWPDLLIPGEPVVLTEKIHGANARFCFSGERLWVGSHTQIKRESTESMWWIAARRYDLAHRLALAPDLVFYGEVYGQVQDLLYDVSRSEGIRLAFFDICDAKTRCYLDYEACKALLDRLGLPEVPRLAVEGWSSDLRRHAEGTSTIANNVRERHNAHVTCIPGTDA